MTIIQMSNEVMIPKHYGRRNRKNGVVITHKMKTKQQISGGRNEEFDFGHCVHFLGLFQ